MQQQILPLELPSALEAKDFIVSPANEEAFLWLKRWPNWPNRCLAIYGEKGCGKTHLSNIWKSITQARYLNSQEFNAADLKILFEGSPVFILDDAHLIEKEEKLFHFYNHLLSNKGALLLLSHTPPAHWKTSLPDLRSRLNAIPALKIHAPDETLLFQVIQKFFHDLQLHVEDAVISFLLKYIERSFESAYFWVDKLNTYALTEKRSITIPLVRELLLQKDVAEKYL